jgi:hypothetical protein
MITRVIKLYRPGEAGSLGTVCEAYFDRPNHEGCPFQRVCCVGNLPVKKSPIRVINNVDAETLEAMAKAIRATMKKEKE